MSAANAVLGLLAVFVLTAGTGYFVAQEFAYVSADRLALAREAEVGDGKAARALKVLDRLSFMLSGAQPGITVCMLGLGSISKPAISHELDPLLHKLGLPSALSYAPCLPRRRPRRERTAHRHGHAGRSTGQAPAPAGGVRHPPCPPPSGRRCGAGQGEHRRTACRPSR